MKIALAQIEVIPGNLAANFAKMSKVYSLLAPSYDLVAFPEMALPGYFIGDTWEQTAFLRECESLTFELAKLSTQSMLVFGSVGIDWKRKNEDGRVRKFNAAFCAQNGKLIKHPKLPFAFWPKSLSPNYREFDESRHFVDLRKYAAEKGENPASLLAPVDLRIGSKSFRIAVNICEDAWDKDYTFSPIHELSKSPLDCILNLSCSPYTLAKSLRRHQLFSNIVKETGIPLAYVNCVGMQNLGKTVFGFDGASTFYTPSESSPKRARNFEECVLGCDLASGSALALAIHENASVLTLSPSAFGQAAISETAEIYEALLQTLKYILKQWQISKLVIGVSGGIDSALSAAIYTQILGPQSVLLVNMPSQYNSELTKNAAEDLAKRLHAPFAVVPIQDSFAATVAQLNAVHFSQNLGMRSLQNLHLENIQARDRSARILAGLAALYGGVFACNSNKTELTVGYSTLYGDAGGFLAALGDLWKGQVYALARYFNNEVAGKELIPLESIQVVPSAELSFDQDVLRGKGDPLIYPYHDALFRTWVEDWERKTPEDMLSAFIQDNLDTVLGISREALLGYFKNDVQAFVNDLEKWWSLYIGMGAFKRVQAPPILALSRRAFGSDHRENLGTAHLSRRYYELRSKLLSFSLKKL